MKTNYFKQIIDKYTKEIIKALVKDFVAGAISVNYNEYLEPTKEEIKLMTNKVYDNIKGVTEEDSKKINNIIRDSLLNRESRIDIAKKLDSVFKGENPTKLNYKTRLKTIARTESVNFFNQGAFKNAQRLGATHKYLIIKKDKRTSCLCEKLYSKYGIEEKAIPINSNFELFINGKKVSQLLPPFHPNCRTSVGYTFK